MMDGPFLREHGELDKIHLKQLRWIHHHINLPNCPIQGWSERLVQKALDSLANNGTVAMLCSRYDLTMNQMSCRYQISWCVTCVTIPSASLVRLAEGKTPLGRILAMCGGEGCFRTTSDLDFFRVAKQILALYDDAHWSSSKGQGSKKTNMSEGLDVNLCSL